MQLLDSQYMHFSKPGDSCNSQKKEWDFLRKVRVKMIMIKIRAPAKMDGLKGYDTDSDNGEETAVAKDSHKVFWCKDQVKFM